MAADTQTEANSGAGHDDPEHDDAGQNDAGQDASEGKNAVEWGMVLLGGAIVLFTFGYLIFKIVGGADAPPDLRIALGTPETRGDLVLVPVEVKNEGGSVAQKATIEVCAGSACAQLDFPFVPHQAVRRGQIGFRAPLAGPLRSRVMSYRE